MALSRTIFFASIREHPFGGALKPWQVFGVNQILDYREKTWPAMSDAELAYLLATVYWGTAHTMKPIREMGGDAYLKSKSYYPWYGRGLVQITWKKNYDLFGIVVADDALKWDVALDVCFRGMIMGMFTGKKLSDYVIGEKTDYVNARRIINGTDKAEEIAKIAGYFRQALKDAQVAEPSAQPAASGPVAAEPVPIPTPAPITVTPPAPEPVAPVAPIIPPVFIKTQKDQLLECLKDADIRAAIAQIVAERLS